MTLPPQTITLLAVNSVAIAVAVLSLVLLCIQRNKNPVTSRRVASFVAIIAHLTCIISLYVEIAVSNCFIVVNAVFPASLLLYGVYLVQLLRYLIQLRDQYAKQEYASNKGIVKVLKIVASKWVSLLFLVVLLAVYYISIYAIYGVGFRTCNSDFVTACLIPYYVISIGLALIGMVALLIHMCTTRNCNLFRYAQDPFRFQLEFLLVVLYNIIATILQAIIAILLPAYNNSFIVVLFNIGNMFLLPGFSICLSFAWQCCCNAKQNQKFGTDMPTILANTQLRSELKQFAAMELSVENILCFEQIQLFKQAATRASATELIATFLESYSALEVNIRRSHVAHVKQQMQQALLVSETVVPATLFDEIETAICDNILDTFQRFRRNKRNSVGQ